MKVLIHRDRSSPPYRTFSVNDKLSLRVNIQTLLRTSK